jgi:hypothetical protein
VGQSRSAPSRSCEYISILSGTRGRSMPVGCHLSGFGGGDSGWICRKFNGPRHPLPVRERIDNPPARAAVPERISSDYRDEKLAKRFTYLPHADCVIRSRGVVLNTVLHVMSDTAHESH